MVTLKNTQAQFVQFDDWCAEQKLAKDAPQAMLELYITKSLKTTPRLADYYSFNPSTVKPKCELLVADKKCELGAQFLK